MYLVTSLTVSTLALFMTTQLQMNTFNVIFVLCSLLQLHPVEWWSSAVNFHMFLINSTSWCCRVKFCLLPLISAVCHVRINEVDQIWTQSGFNRGFTESSGLTCVSSFIFHLYIMFDIKKMCLTCWFYTLYSLIMSVKQSQIIFHLLKLTSSAPFMSWCSCWSCFLPADVTISLFGPRLVCVNGSSLCAQWELNWWRQYFLSDWRHFTNISSVIIIELKLMMKLKWWNWMWIKAAQRWNVLDIFIQQSKCGHKKTFSTIISQTQFLFERERDREKVQSVWNEIQPIQRKVKRTQINKTNEKKYIIMMNKYRKNKGSRLVLH